MKGVAIAVGCLFFFGGFALVTIADQQRAAAMVAVKAEIVRVERALDESNGENLELAARLTALRSEIAEQDQQIADTTGFLQ